LETKPLGESNLALSLFGAVGIVLGPALLALLRALLDLYSEEYSNIERP
jgi:predicted PurR-regulated permease PerM